MTPMTPQLDEKITRLAQIFEDEFNRNWKSLETRLNKLGIPSKMVDWALYDNGFFLDQVEADEEFYEPFIDKALKEFG